MARCVNISSKEFKSLLTQTGLPDYLLSAKIGVWQEQNNTDEFPTKGELLKNQNELLTKIKTFLDTQGFKVEDLDEYFSNYKARTGQSIDESGVNALVDTLEKVVAVKNGEEGSVVQEAAHIAIAMAPKTFKYEKALDEVVNTQEYKDNAEVYRKRYSKLEPNKSQEQIETKVRKEIMGRLLEQVLLKEQVEEPRTFLSLLKAIWNNFINFFKTDNLNSFISEIKGEILRNNTDFFNKLEQDGIYFDIDTNLTPEQKIIRNIIHDQKLRIKKLKERGLVNQARETKELNDELEKNQNILGIAKFLAFLHDGNARVLDFIKSYRDNNKTPNDKQIKELGDFIHYYLPSLLQLRANSNLLSDNLRTILKSQISVFEDVKDFYDQVQKDRIIKNTREDKAISPDFDIEKILDEPGNDLNQLQMLGGTLRDVSDGFARLIYAKVGQILYKTFQQTYNKGKELIDKSYNEFKIKTTDKFAEKDSKGKTTGYFISQHRMGDFWNNYEEAKKQRDLIENDNERKNFWNKWLQDNTERLFSKEYYDLKNSLSLETQEDISSIRASMDAILNKYRKENGDLAIEDLSDEDFEQYKLLLIERKKLASYYDENGDMKTGRALNTAIELKKYNDKFFQNVKYKKNQKKFNEAKVAKAKELTPDKFKKWLDRNTEIEYSEEFWNNFSKYEKNEYGPDYEDLLQKRRELLKPYRVNNIEVDFELLPENIQEEIRQLDRQLQTEREKGEKKLKEGVQFDEFAEIVKSDAYYKARKKAQEEGKEDEFMNKHHYYDAKGYRHTYSYFTKIQPKNKDHIILSPNLTYNEVDPDSNWFNPNYDKNFRGLQPKADKYKNKEYDKLSQNEKDYLTFLMNQKWEADEMMGVDQYKAYQMPQVSSSMMDVLYSRSNILSKFKELAKESVLRRVDDEQLFGSLDNEYLSDGTRINYVAKKFTRKLENPEVISTDILSSLILYWESAHKYKTMIKEAPALENLQEQMGNRKYIKGRKILKGNESNLYKMVDSFLNSHVYDINLTNAGEFKLLGQKFDVAKVARTVNNYVRNNNLIFNTYSILTNVAGGWINGNLDNLIGRYTSIKAGLWAEKEFAKNSAAALYEYNKPLKNNKMLVALEYFNVLEQKTLFDNLDKTSIRRLTPKDVTYLGWNQGAFYMKGRTALAVMYNQRWNPKTKTFVSEQQYKLDPIENKKFTELTSIYDMMEVKDHQFKVKEEYKDIVTEDYLAKLNAIIEQRTTMVDGNLSNLDKSMAHRDALWSLVTTHRGWFFDGIQRRFKKQSKNLLTDHIESGWYRNFFTDFLPNTLFKNKKFSDLAQLFDKEFWNSLEPHQKEAVYKTMLDMLVVLVLSILAKYWNGDDDDEDEFKAYLANRLLLETSALSPSPMAIYELTQILNSPVAGVRQVEFLFDFKDIFSGEEIERGRFKGLTKREKFLIRLIPGLKGYYMSSDPQSSNQFLKTTSLKWLY